MRTLKEQYEQVNEVLDSDQKKLLKDMTKLYDRILDITSDFAKERENEYEEQSTLDDYYDITHDITAEVKKLEQYIKDN